MGTENRPEIDIDLRRANRSLETEKLLALLRSDAPRFFEIAEVVGKWVWIQFSEKQPPTITSVLAELGFHWNNTRQAWQQHPQPALDCITSRAPIRRTRKDWRPASRWMFNYPVMNVLTLSRLQFALTAGIHYLYPPLSIGLGVMLVLMEGMWLATRKPIYHQMARFWTKVFALTFAIGVATGIVMEFEFGTNWATYSRYVGDVFGSALAAEGIFAFFLESGFLAVLLFGWDRVGPKMHFFATCMVCLGAHFSAIWIVVANSWMQTPAGFHIVGEGLKARAEITDFWAMVFNPSSMDRLFHTLCGAWQAGASLVVSVSAWYLLKGRHGEFARASLRVGLIVGLTASLLQLLTGHISGQGVARNQPVKLAAFEGLYHTTPSAPLSPFGWVDEKDQQVIGPRIPCMLSFLAYGNFKAPVAGLDDAAPDPNDRPPVNVTFQLFHLMVAMGMWMILISALGFLYFWHGSLFEKRWLLWLLVWSVLGPQIANQAGWFAAEVGRQPWIVQGLLRTSRGLSAVVTANTVLSAIILFSLVYVLLFAVFIFLLNDKIQHGPDEADLIPAGKLVLPDEIAHEFRQS